MDKISVIIPTEGTLDWKHQSILHVVAALKSQVNVELEIIAAVQNVANNFLASMNDAGVKVIETAHKYSGGKRNKGAEFACNENLLFIDDDTVVIGRDSLSKICQILAHNDFACGANRYWSSFYWYKHVSPLLSSSTNITILKNISILPRGINRAFGFRDLNEFTFIGNFGAIKKNVFNKINMFNENFPVYGYEDTDLMMRLCMAGFHSELLYERSIGVIHLTHPVKTEESLSINGCTFDSIQRERGYYFQANHFFGVYEGDGHAIITPCEELEKMLGSY